MGHQTLKAENKASPGAVSTPRSSQGERHWLVVSRRLHTACVPQHWHCFRLLVHLPPPPHLWSIHVALKLPQYNTRPSPAGVRTRWGVLSLKGSLLTSSRSLLFFSGWLDNAIAFVVLLDAWLGPRPCCSAVCLQGWWPSGWLDEDPTRRTGNDAMDEAHICPCAYFLI